MVLLKIADVTTMEVYNCIEHIYITELCKHAGQNERKQNYSQMAERESNVD